MHLQAQLCRNITGMKGCEKAEADMGNKHGAPLSVIL